MPVSRTEILMTWWVCVSLTISVRTSTSPILPPAVNPGVNFMAFAKQGPAETAQMLNTSQGRIEVKTRGCIKRVEGRFEQFVTGPTESRLSTTCLRRSPSPRTLGGMRGSITQTTSIPLFSAVMMTESSASSTVQEGR